eukprot:scaffold102515_cov63-Attheya_sp.AAC.3
MKKVSRSSGPTVECITTWGDEELYSIQKDQFTDTYVMHLKSDLEECKKVKSDLKMVGGFARRVSKENHVVALSQDPDTFDKTPIQIEDRLALDSYMMDTDIINFMEAHFVMPESGDIHWAAENAEIKDSYFSGPVYPDVAISKFGYMNNYAALVAAANPVAETVYSSEDNSSDDDEVELKSNASEENSSEDDEPRLRSNASRKRMPPSMAKGIK